MRPTTRLLRPVIARVADVRAPALTSELERLAARKQRADADADKLATAAAAIGARLDRMLAAVRKETTGRPRAVAGAVAVRVVGASRGDAGPVPLPDVQVILTTAAGSATARTDTTGLAVLTPPVPDAAPADDRAAVLADRAAVHAERAALADRAVHAERPASGDEPASVLAERAALFAAATAAPRQPTAAATAALPAYQLHLLAGDGSKVGSVDGGGEPTHLVQLGEAQALEGHLAAGRKWLAALDRVAARRDQVAKVAEGRLAQHLASARDRVTAIKRRIDQHSQPRRRDP